MTDQHELALLRLAAQRIAGSGMAGAAEAVHWMAAMQGQDLHGALTSVAIRTESRSLADVEAALNDGSVVRSWPMRGTLHLVAAEDLPWMLRLGSPRILAGAAARRDHLGLDLDTLEAARELAIEALAGGKELARKELLAVWEEAGLAIGGQRGYHTIWYLAQTGTLCFGPMRDREQLIVLLGEWIPEPRRIEGEEALGEWAWRYFRSHGPATVKDFARWTNLAAADVKVGLAVAHARLAHVEVDGVEYLMDPDTPERLAAFRNDARGMFLLPGFDEFILGYRDRRACLAAEFATRIVPGGNGVFRPTIVSDGQVVGTWSHQGKGAGRSLAAVPFTSFSTKVDKAIAKVYANLPQPSRHLRGQAPHAGSMGFGR